MLMTSSDTQTTDPLSCPKSAAISLFLNDTEPLQLFYDFAEIADLLEARDIKFTLDNR
jgi:hypothetical protein